MTCPMDFRDCRTFPRARAACVAGVRWSHGDLLSVNVAIGIGTKLTNVHTSENLSPIIYPILAAADSTCFAPTPDQFPQTRYREATAMCPNTIEANLDDRQKQVQVGQSCVQPFCLPQNAPQNPLLVRVEAEILLVDNSDSRIDCGDFDGRPFSEPMLIWPFHVAQPLQSSNSTVCRRGDVGCGWVRSIAGGMSWHRSLSWQLVAR